jgi:hypothetical protein
VTAGCCYFERPHYGHVASHFRKIVLVAGSRFEHLVWINHLTLGLPASDQELFEFSDPSDPNDIQSRDKRSFSDIRSRHHKTLTSGTPRRIGDRERTTNRPDQPVEAKFATDGVLRQLVVLDLSASCQQSCREREIKAWSCLAKIGRSKVRGYSPKWKLESAIDQRGADPLA